MAAGSATGAARRAPPTAAKLNPIARVTLKNFDVGAVNRSINVNFLFTIFFVMKNNRLDMIYPFFKKLNALIHQIIDTLKFGFDEGSGGSYFAQIFFNSFKVSMQLFDKECHHREQYRNKYSE
jgi:hypothetical protein